LHWGALPPADSRAVALVVFPAFVVQLIVGILAFLSRDSIAATLMMSLATTWLVDSVTLYIQPRGYADTLGIFFLLFGVFAAFMLTTSLLKRALAVVVAVAVPRFLISGVAELTGIHAVSQAAAVLGFLLTAVALYTAFALLLEDSRGREVLPVGRLGPARHATHDNLAFQLRGIERQAGVRRTL
jgi:uncharacterized protein